MAKRHPNQQPVNLATTMVAISVSVADLNTMMEALGELPAKKSHRLINVLQTQALVQLRKPEPTADDKAALDKAAKKRERKALRLAGGTEKG